MRLNDNSKDFTPKRLDEVQDNVRWYAELWGQYVHFVRIEVVSRTPQGLWLRDDRHDKKYWRGQHTHKATPTRRAALYSLWRRKASHVRHSEGRLHSAYRDEKSIRDILATTGKELRPISTAFIVADDFFDGLETWG